MPMAMSRISVHLGAAVVAAMLLAGPHGPDLTSRAGATDPGGGAYLIVPFIDLSDIDKAIFLYRVVPELTLHGGLFNAGNAEKPWYCLAFGTTQDAEAALASLRHQTVTRAIARQALIDRHCAAG